MLIPCSTEIVCHYYCCNGATLPLGIIVDSTVGSTTPTVVLIQTVYNCLGDEARKSLHNGELMLHLDQISNPAQHQYKSFSVDSEGGLVFEYDSRDVS